MENLEENLENKGNLKANSETETMKALLKILDDEIRFDSRAYPDTVHPSWVDWIPCMVGHFFFHYRTRKEHEPMSAFDVAYLDANLLYSGFTFMGAILGIPYLI